MKTRIGMNCNPMISEEWPCNVIRCMIGCAGVKRARCLVGSVIATILGGAAVAAAAAQGNLLTNGDFTRGLEGWKVDMPNWYSREHIQPIGPQLDTTVSTGQRGRSLKLAMTKGMLGSVSQTVSLDPKHKKYRLRFWIKTKDLTDEVFTGVTVNWNKPKNAPGFGNEWARVLVEAPQWLQLERIANIESTDGRATISLFINRRSAGLLPEKGTAWFGGIEFLPLKDKSVGPVWQPPADFKPVATAAAGKGYGYLPSHFLPDDSKPLDVKLTRFRPGLAATTNFGLTYDVSNGKRFCAPSFIDVGVFRKGEPITMVLEGTNPSPQARRIGVRLRVKDFYGTVSPEIRLTLQVPPGEFRKQLTLANAERYGFFAVLAEVWAAGRMIAWAPSSFCVLEKSEQDPFFDLNELQGAITPGCPSTSTWASGPSTSAGAGGERSESPAGIIRRISMTCGPIRFTPPI